MSVAASSAKTLLVAIVGLLTGLPGMLIVPTAQGATGALLYNCSGPGFGMQPSYGFQAIVDTDLPAAMPYGSARVTTWITQLVAPDSFLSWAQMQGFTTLFAGARLGTSQDGVPQTEIYQTSPALAVPATTGAWTWTITPTTTNVAASVLGHHALSLTALQVTVAFHDAAGPRLATTATCVLDPSVPVAATTVDTYDVVAATTATTLAVKGDTATATVTSNGAPAAGTVTFSVAGKSVTAAVFSGKATAKIPNVPPGTYTVSATFVPAQPGQFTTSTGIASYAVPRIGTKTKASAGYRPARDLVKARARVRAPDGSDVSGRVTFILKRNGQAIRKATVRLSGHGVATKKFRGVQPTGTYVVVARYLGNRAFKPSTDRVRFTLP